MRATIAAREFARSLDRTIGPDLPLTHVDDPYAIQFYRGTMRPTARVEQAAKLLAGPDAAYVALFEAWRLQKMRGGGGPPLYELASVRLSPEVMVTILSNRQRFDPREPAAVRAGPLVLRVRGVRFAEGGDGWFALTDVGEGGTAAVTNDSDRPRTVRVILDRGGERGRRVERVGPGETWTWRLDEPGHGPMS